MQHHSSNTETVTVFYMLCLLFKAFTKHSRA